MKSAMNKVKGLTCFIQVNFLATVLLGAFMLALPAKVGAQTDEWEWVQGYSTINHSGVYGTQGVASTSNFPGSRYSGLSWRDTSGNFWLFGGYGNDSVGAYNRLNDLWERSSTTDEWTWVDGSNTINGVGVYGTKGVASASNVPSARFESSSWTDQNGNFWLFGGNTNTSTNNDLWTYSTTTKEWTWVGGSSGGNQAGIYGTKGTASSSNVPGARWSAVSWADLNGNLWLFGGYGYDSVGTNGYLNDLWMY